jgi:Spy/CpxP family protein refolding chaperone
MILRPRIVFLFAGGFALALAAGSARAQSSDRLGRMRHDLALTEDQAKQVETILTADAAQEAKDKADAAADPAKLKALGRARRQKTDAQIDALLTPEQRAKRHAKSGRKKKRGAAHASPAPAAAPASPTPGAKPPAATLAPQPTPTPKPGEP